jgi:2'-5' RNA ligase
MVSNSRHLESAIILEIPEAEGLVSKYRIDHDPSAVFGIPAHMTTLYPFLPPDKIDEKVLNSLANIFSKQESFEVVFDTTGQFPSVLYLEPKFSEPLVRLTKLVEEAFPDYPPYGGVFPNITPHLTIAQIDDEQLLKIIDKEIRNKGRAQFPIVSQIKNVAIYVEGTPSWTLLATLPLGK